MRKTLTLIILMLILSGCATTWEPQGSIYQQEQFNLLKQEAEIRKADYNKRLGEIEQAYTNGKLTEGEYLTLKNALKQEWHDYCSEIDRRTNYITQQAIRLNHPYVE